MQITLHSILVAAALAAFWWNGPPRRPASDEQAYTVLSRPCAAKPPAGRPFFDGGKVG